jgi:hypothetical protein
MEVYSINQDRQQLYDKRNSLSCLWVAYLNEHTQNYFMRFSNDKSYQGNSTENDRVMKMLVERINAEWEVRTPGNQRMRLVRLYRNNSQGEKSGAKNEVIFQISFDRYGFIEKAPQVLSCRTEAERKYWSQMLALLVSHSEKQKKEFFELFQNH